MTQDKQIKETEDPDIREGKIFAVIAYWFFLCVVPLILKKENRFAVYHGKQGLVLFIFLVAGFILGILPLVGPMIFRIALFLYLILFVWGSIQALMGNYARIPVVSDIAKKIIL